MNRNFLYGAKDSYPERVEQDRIAAILSAYDALIENNRRRIALLEEGARQLYKEWFVRFPGHGHVKIIEGVPEGWERLPLREVATRANERGWMRIEIARGLASLFRADLLPFFCFLRG